MNERVIFDAALEIADPQARRAFVEKACGGDPAMLAAVESLLKSHDAAGSFLDIPIARQMQSATPSNPSESSAADEKTRTYQPGAIDDDSIDDTDDTRLDLSFMQPSSKPGSIGVLAHYEVLSVLGQGAFGIVFKAFDEKLHRLVAIKVMNPQLAATSPPRKRFLREARAAAAIRHENVVQVYSVEEQPLPYLVMEFIDGQTLKEKLDGAGPLETLEILHIGRQIASGLAAAQAMGLIHRDIKPANILLEQGAEQRVKISDFGLARAADDASMTRTGVISGTPMYMAPEQARGQTLDHRADLFSLGTVLYTMASGRPPFRASNTIAVLKRVCEDTPRPVSEVIPGSPQWLDEIIAKLHAKEPDDRFQTAKEVSDLLARCQSELQLNGHVTCVAVPPQHDAPASGRDESRPPKSSPHVPREESRTSTDANRATDNALPTMSTPRSAYFTRSVKATFAAVIGITVLAAITFKLRDNEARRMAAPGRPSDTVPNTQQTAECGHPTNPGWHGWPADAPPPAIAPFNADQAKQHQEAWAAYLKVPAEYTNSIGMKFRLIPPGVFLMGSTPEEIEETIDLAEGSAWFEDEKKNIQSEGPQHEVILTQPYYFGIHEVTQSQYETVIGKNPSQFAPSGLEKNSVAGIETAHHPVDMVSWNDAIEFCTELSKKERLMVVNTPSDASTKPRHGASYRLPSEAEWEFGCRAGTITKCWRGDQDENLLAMGWVSSNAGGYPHPVGQLEPNPFGLYDMVGNIFEWVEDSYGRAYYRRVQGEAAIDPSNISLNDVLGIIRGGDWRSTLWGCRASHRNTQPKQNREKVFGFRAALTIDAVKAAIANRTTAEAAAGWQGWPADAPPPAIAPFDAEQAKKHQEAWAAYLKVPVGYTNSIGMKFRLIPPGEFMMGSTPEQIADALEQIDWSDKDWPNWIKSEGPQHKTILTQAIYLGIYEVTQAEYEKVIGSNPSHFSPMGEGKKAIASMNTTAHPVESVTWNDAAEYCSKLSKSENVKPYYARSGESVITLEGTGYRLPTEATWEFACRAGTTAKCWIGDQADGLVSAGWFKRNSNWHTHTVGELKSNPFGLYDTHGNVYEWVHDAWESTFYKTNSDRSVIDPSCSPGNRTLRVMRGGYWDRSVSHCCSSSRVAFDQSFRSGANGFRIALSVEAVRQALKVTRPAKPKPAATTPSAPANE